MKNPPKPESCFFTQLQIRNYAPMANHINSVVGASSRTAGAANNAAANAALARWNGVYATAIEKRRIAIMPTEAHEIEKVIEALQQQQALLIQKSRVPTAQHLDAVAEQISAAKAELEKAKPQRRNAWRSLSG